MNPEFHRLMAEARRLTGQNDLAAATAAIHSALGMASSPLAPHNVSAASGAVDVIDLDPADVREVPGTRAPAPAPAADGGRFITGRFSGAGLQRDYRLFIPPGAGTGPLPLVVMLHGCTQDANDFAAGTAMNEAARTQPCYVLYPVQSRDANPQGCWNWFKHSHQQRGRGEPALIAGMVAQVMADHTVDASRVYVAGLSAGGAMAAILGQTYPELFAAVGVHSGLAAGVATDLPGALAAMKSGGPARGQAPTGMPTIVFHGDADKTVHPRNGEQVIAAAVGPNVTLESAPSGSMAARRTTRRVHVGTDGRTVAEHWVVHGSPHAWSGGSTQGSYTDARGPDASAEMLRFFLQHRHPQR